jgi:hypothetical protein
VQAEISRRRSFISFLSAAPTDGPPHARGESFSKKSEAPMSTLVALLRSIASGKQTLKTKKKGKQ